MSQATCSVKISPNSGRFAATAVALLLSISVSAWADEVRSTVNATNVVPPTVVSPAAATASNATAAQPPRASRLTLGQAALMAARNHPDLKISRAQWEQSVARWQGAYDPYYPNLNGSVNYSYSEAQSAATGGQALIRQGGTRNYSLGLTATQMLLDFGRTRSAVLGAEKTRDAAETDLENKTQDVLLNVAVQYFGLLRAQQSVTLNQDNVRNALTQLGRAQGQYQAGTKAKIEVTRAQADLAAAEFALIQAQNNERRVRAALSTSVGDVQLADYAVQELAVNPPKLSEAQVIDIAAETRPDLKAVKLRLEASRYNAEQQELQYWPSLNANARYGWSDKTFLPSPYSWSVGLSLDVPIFNEPFLSQQLASAQASVKIAEAQVELTGLNARQQVVEAYSAMQEAQQQIVSAQSALSVAQENFRLASERYQVGVGSSLEISDAQRLLVQARAQELQAKFDLQTATVRLYRQLGRLDLDLLLSSFSPQSVAPGR